MWDNGRREYYVSSAKRSGSEYVAQGRRVSESGEFIEACQKFFFKTQVEAERKARDLAKVKRSLHGCVHVSEVDVPECVKRHLGFSMGEQVTAEELERMLKDARKERYVVLGNVSGIENWFDAGVEYVGCRSEEDGEYVWVYDKFGNFKELCMERVASVRLTEKALEAGEKELEV